MNDFAAAFAVCPLIAILRGVRPHEVVPIGEALADAGFTLIEIPLNSPDPLESISRLTDRLGNSMMIGAGTVLTTTDVAAVAAAGGRMTVSPNTDAAVIGATVRAGMISVPGYSTPTEAFAAIAAGATALKLFPAEAASPSALKAHRAVLPRNMPILAVGSITPETIGSWRAAGADGFGLGSALYRPGASAAAVAEAARGFVAAWNTSR